MRLLKLRLAIAVLLIASASAFAQPRAGADPTASVFLEDLTSPELAAAAQLTVHGALQQWLGDVIHIEGVNVVSQDSQLAITVQYVIRRSQERNTATFTRSAP